MKTSLLSAALFFAVLSFAQAEIFDAGGGAIYYEVQGKGKAIVFLHGGFGDSRMWNSQFEEFAKRYRVLRYDQPGFGKSYRPEQEYSPASILLKLLDHLAIEKATLVGNSMGGTLAIDFALLNPKRVERLVIVGSGPGGFPVPKEDQERMNQVFVAAAQQGIPAAIDLWLANPMVAVAMKQDPARSLLQTMVKDNGNIFRMRYWPIEKIDPPAATRLKEIDKPSLVIVGDQDAPLIQTMVEAVTSGILGSKKIVMKGTDHLPQMEDPDTFNQAVFEFMK